MGTKLTIGPAVRATARLGMLLPRDVDKLVALGRRLGGGGELGPGVVAEPIEALLAGVDAESDDGPLKGWVRASALLSISSRARINAYWEEHPEVQHREIAEPLFIVGWPRTGTTLLLNLLALHKGMRPLLGWETLSVLPPKPGRRDRRQAQWSQFVKISHRFQPQMREIHELKAEGPEEDVFLLDRTFLPARNRYTSPSFAEWLSYQSRETIHEAHTIYRRQIEILDAESPGPHWLIKSPQLLSVVDMLAHHFPGGMIVQTHRDLRAALPSMISLLSQFNTADLSDVLHNHKYTMDFVAAHRASGAALPFVDVDYRVLLREPFAVCARILEKRGLDPDAAYERDVARYLRENTSDGERKHTYSLEQFGLDEARADELNAEYSELFDLGW